MPCQQSTPPLLKIKQISSEIYSTEFTLESLIYFWNQIFFQKCTHLNHLGKGLWMCPHFTITMNSKNLKYHADFTRLTHKDYKKQHSIISVGNGNIFLKGTYVLSYWASCSIFTRYSGGVGTPFQTPKMSQVFISLAKIFTYFIAPSKLLCCYEPHLP